MKPALLFFFATLFSFSLFAQVESPPPPCGFLDIKICDDIGDDGIVVINLREVLPFQMFCLAAQNSVMEEDYHSITYYLNESDMTNEVNPIGNPESFRNSSKDFEIYFRANKKIPEGFTTDVLYRNGTIEILIGPSINQPTSFEKCDDASKDGIEIFDLTTKIPEIVGGGLTDVGVTLHETMEGAETNNDVIVNSTNYTNNMPAVQTIYVRVEHYDTGCYSITSFDLIVRDCDATGVIEINAFYDKDENGIFDNDEFNFLNGVLRYVKNNDGITRYLYASDGNFKIISDENSDVFDISYSIFEEFENCYNLIVNSYENVSISNGNTITYNFPVTKIMECGDIAVYLVSNIPPRPGFDYKNYLVVENKGIETISSGTVEFTMDATLSLNGVSFVNAGNSVTNTANGFNLNFTNLQPNSYERVRVDMKVPIPTPLGTVLTNKAQYTGSDVNMDNNYTELSEVVIGSYDPNDILESHGPEIVHSSFTADDYLYYTVRFQNVGTADAINVSIDNTLDSRLDKSTIKMLSSSHDNVFTRIDNQLNWQFDNIHLPSEDMDEPNSHGYVYYKIKPTAGYSVGDIIPNTAEIYFDFNPAVITNTFETEFTTTLSVYSNVNTLFSMSPNPAHDFVELGFNKYIGNPKLISIYDIQGKLIKRVSYVAPSKVKLDVSQLDTGLYFLKVNSGVSEDIKKLIIR